ncbi:MAG TPA: TIM barrel protein, partial [Thermoanaerobaculia bacterium]|nr:TIM barrel protein [Thermoanaerobaculia bacterium]
TAVELSALRDHELPELVNALPSLDLQGFAYVSFHAPSKLQTLDEQSVFELLLRLPQAWPIVAHPEILRTPSRWRRLGARLCLENMDDRKTTGRTPGELRALFEQFPEASFCLDLGHARQIDPTMASALRMLRELGGRLRQVHVSEAGTRGEHLPLGATTRMSFAQVAHRIPADCPLIIESVIPPEEMERELDAVSAALETLIAEAIA